MTSSDYKKKVLYLILITFVARCVIGSVVELGNDEVYYFTYALQPDWNHFDHPPIVGFLIRFFTINLHWLSDLSMRLGAIVSSSIATWFIFLCGRIIRNERTGWIAALLYNLSIYTSIIAGLFILPDSPQLIFWTASLYCMLVLVQRPENKYTSVYMLLLGLLTGLAVMSKVHGIFLWAGFGAYILLYDRKWLKNPYLYLSFIITLVVASPLLFWNIQHDFITFKFHGERVEVNTLAVNFSSFITTTVGQILYNNPFHIIIYLLVFLQLRRSGISKKLKQLLLWLSLPIIVLTSGISLFRDTLPHWSGPGFVSLMLLSAYVIDEVAASPKKPYLLLIKISAYLISFALVLAIGMINFYPGTLGKTLPKERYGAADITLDMYGWHTFGKEFRQLREKEIEEQVMKRSDRILFHNWYPASHTLFYVLNHSDLQFAALGPIQNLHKYAWLNQEKPNIMKGESFYFIAASNYFFDPFESYKDDFEEIILSSGIPCYRSGKVVKYYFVYHLKHARRNIALTRPILNRNKIL